MDADKRTELTDRYTRAAHAMQAGVGMMMNKDPLNTTPKHLRVGVNSALVDSAVLAKLLIDKGVITEEEYLTALAEGMEAERDRYTAEVKHAFGGNIDITLV